VQVLACGWVQPFAFHRIWSLGTTTWDAPMQHMTLDVEAGQVSTELAHRGIPARTRVRVLVEVPDDADLPMTAMAQAGGAFEFLEEEPDLYTDADAIERFG
jgi:hypothetical protein